MIIDDEIIRVQYESTAESPIIVGDVLPVPYGFTEKEQLNAVLSNGTNLVYKQDYTVGDTSITLSVDIPIGETITIYRSTPLDQCSEFPQEAKFNSKKIEDALDKLTMQNQEQREALSRALKLPLTASTDISDLSLPSPVPNKAVKWNSDGTALVNTDFDSDLALVLTEQYKDQAQQAAVKAENQQNIATEQAGIATDKANAAANSATQAAETLAAAVTTIATEKEEAIEAVQNQQVNSINAVKAQQNTSINAVKSQQNTSVNALKAEGTTQVNLAKAEVTKATNQANDAKNYAAVANSAADTAKATLNAAKAEITAEKTNAVNAVKTQQSTSVSAVQKQQTSSVNTVKSTGQGYIDKCKAWASSDRAVEGGLYSAKHYAEMAQGKSDVTYEHLRASRVYNDKGMLLTDEEGYADVAEMNRSTFDLSKFFVVGSPTITEDGVASGFSNTIYLSPSINFLNPSNIKISISGILSELTGTAARTYFSLMSGDNILRLYLNNKNKLSGEVGSITSGNHRYLGGDSYPLPLNAKFKTILNIDVKNNTVQQVVYINDGLLFEGPKQTPIAFNFDTDFVFSSATMKLGAGGYNGFTGSIDLSHFSITADGKEVFNGNKTGLDVIKPDDYIVEGSPVISEDGVASGFNSTSKIKKTISVSPKNKFKVTGKCTYYKTGKVQQFCTFNNTGSTRLVLVESGSIIIYDSSVVVGLTQAEHGLENGDEFVYSLDYDLKTNKVLLSVNSVLKETVYTLNMDMTYVNLSMLNNPFAGSIDLNTFKIYVDGQLVYQPCLKISYNLSENGAKVVPAYARDKVLDVYENHDKGYAYYTIDEENKNFTLPLGTTFDNSLRRNLENITENGNEKLTTSLMYETGNVSNDEKGYKQLTKMNRSTFDLSKFTVVGSPTITEDGVVSGFSESNYLQGATGITLGDNFKIQAKITTGDDVTSYQGLLRMQSSAEFLCSISNRTNGSRLVLGIPDNSDISVIPAMKTNTEYKILIECRNGLLTTYYSENNSNFIKVSEVKDINISKTNSLFLLGNNTANVYWRGSIDLKQFSIIVDDKEVFNGNKTGLDVIKHDNYIVVGKPVISEDGIITAQDGGGNRIDIPCKSLEDFIIDVTFSNNVNKYWWGYLLSGFIEIYHYQANGTFQINWRSTSGFQTICHVPYIQGARYKIRIIKTAETVKAEVYINDAFSTSQTLNVTGSTPQTTNYLKVCDVDTTIQDKTLYYPATVDLNNIKIYQDGQIYQPCLKIPYNVSKTGSKIVPAYARDRVIDLYQQEGHAGYYTIDEEKKNFTLPMGEIFGLIGQRSLRSVTRDGANYCEIYSDKTIEQGGTCTANVEVTLQQPFADRNYVLSVPYSNKTATSFIPTQTGDWIAKGKGV